MKQEAAWIVINTAGSGAIHVIKKMGESTRDVSWRQVWAEIKQMAFMGGHS